MLNSPEVDILKMLSTMDAETLTLLGAACGVMLSLHFTVQLITQHLFYWKTPKEQMAIIIIVLMAPLYAVDSFVGLLDIQGSRILFTFLHCVKQCYEALVGLCGLINFFGMCSFHIRILYEFFLQFTGDC